MAPSPPSFPSPLAGKKIIVVGAGIAGLAFVISLRRCWKEEHGAIPEIIVYERDIQQPETSRDGYSIGIRSSQSCAGAQALRKMNILDAIIDESVTRDGNERAYFGIWSLDWSRFMQVRHEPPEGIPYPSMRIARLKIRGIFLERVMSDGIGTITRGVTCTQILPSSDGRVSLELSDGKEESCDFLVVADGANSKLRAAVRPKDKLNFAGPVSISAISRFSGPPPEPIVKDWGTVTSGKGVALFASPVDAQSAWWSLSYIADTPRKELRQPLPPEQNEQLLREARQRGAIFGEPFQTLIDHSDPATTMVINAMDKESFAHSACSNLPAGVVFIGDSNHAVSAFAGNGANLAIMDGYDLAECICAYPSVKEAVEAFDKRSMPRASISLARSRWSIAMMHSSGLMWWYSQWWLTLHGNLKSLHWRKQDWVQTALGRKQ